MPARQNLEPFEPPRRQIDDRLIIGTIARDLIALAELGFELDPCPEIASS